VFSNRNRMRQSPALARLRSTETHRKWLAFMPSQMVEPMLDFTRTVHHTFEHQCRMSVHPHFTMVSSRWNPLLNESLIRVTKAVSSRAFAEHVAPEVVIDDTDREFRAIF